MKTIPNSSATLQYRSISQNRLRPKYCTTNQQHIERYNMLSDQRSKKLQRNGKHLVFYSEINWNVWVLALKRQEQKLRPIRNQERHFHTSRFTSSMSSLASSTDHHFLNPSSFFACHSRSPCLWSSPPAERSLPFTQRRMEEHRSDDAPSQENSQSADP